jgi:hypothetical protein
MSYNKPLTNIEYGVGIITNTILDNVIEEINKLHLDSETQLRILEAINTQKLTITQPPKSKSKSKSKNTEIKQRVISEENQCQRQLKSGGKCHGIKTNNITNSCWGHMSIEEKEQHQLMKNGNNIKSSKKIIKLSYDEQRRLEDLVDDE